MKLLKLICVAMNLLLLLTTAIPTLNGISFQGPVDGCVPAVASTITETVQNPVCSSSTTEENCQPTAYTCTDILIKTACTSWTTITENGCSRKGRTSSDPSTTLMSQTHPAATPSLAEASSYPRACDPAVASITTTASTCNTTTVSSCTSSRTSTILCRNHRVSFGGTSVAISPSMATSIGMGSTEKWGAVAAAAPPPAYGDNWEEGELEGSMSVEVPLWPSV